MLMSVGSLGGVYQEQRRYDEAEPLYAEWLEAMREILHLHTILALSRMVTLYKEQFRRPRRCIQQFFT